MVVSGLTNLSVGGIHHQQIHALFAELAELHQIGDAMVERQLVKLDIAGIDEASGRSLHEHSQSVRNGMRDVHELKIERNDLQLVTTLDLNQSRIDAMLLALGFNESQRELGTNQRNVGAELQQIRHAADMILVAVGKHQSLDLVETILDVVEVRQNQIDTRLLLFGEKHTAVDEQQVTVVFDHVHVAADFTQAAERRDAHGALAVLRRGDQHGILLGCGGLPGGVDLTGRRTAVGSVGVAAARGTATARIRVLACFLLFLCHNLFGISVVVPLLCHAGAAGWQPVCSVSGLQQSGSAHALFSLVKLSGVGTDVRQTHGGGGDNALDLERSLGPDSRRHSTRGQGGRAGWRGDGR